jgi:hypothetical protein
MECDCCSIEQDVQAIRAKHIRSRGFNPFSKGLGFLTQRAYIGPLEEKAQKDVRVWETCIQ